MNKVRRKLIASVIEALGKGDPTGMLEQARADIDDALSDERGAFEAMPESLQQSERGQQAEAAIEALESALEKVDEAVEAFAEIIPLLEGIE